MPEPKHKWGYCPSCVKNIRHFCVPNSRLSRVLDLVSFGRANSLRLGPWYCIHCETRTIYLKEERPDALRFQDAELEQETALDSANSSDNTFAQPIGNFLKSEQSLVMRASRLKRFSEKYRDSVVRRLLNGTGTMAQIRHEKNISEGELTDWIADLFDRMQDRLDQLENEREASPSRRLLDAPRNGSSAETIPTGPTIEGHVKPR